MNGVLGHDSALVRLYWAGTTWDNEMNFVRNHAPMIRQSGYFWSIIFGKYIYTNAVYCMYFPKRILT